MACAWLAAASSEERPGDPAALAGAVDEARWEAVCELIATGVASPLTTSTGRLFDAVAALCGLRAEVNHEGQAAAELEAAAAPGRRSAPRLPDAADRGRRGAADPRRPRDGPRERGRPRRRRRGRTPSRRAFTRALAGARRGLRGGWRTDTGSGAVVLSGGVFQNRLLLERTRARLGGRGLRVLVPQLLPPNDGGISFGQAAIAAFADAGAG